ncbi:MAG: AMP-binding protein, partial [Terriglobales bacterium]
MSNSAANAIPASPLISNSPLPPAPEQPLLLLDLFAGAVARWPGRIALHAPPTDGGAQRNDGDSPRAITYSELSQRAAGVAAALAARVLPEAMVAVLLPRQDPNLYVAQLAILAAGAAFTCLDVNFPDAFVATVASAAAVIVTDPNGRARLQRLGLSTPALCVSELPVAAQALRPAPLPPDRLAYVIHTSGTTGVPNGVAIEHGAIANLVRVNVDYFGVTQHQRVAQC